MLAVAIDPQNNLVWELGVDGPIMNIQYVTAGWLKNPSSMPPRVKKKLDAAGLTRADYAKILSVNPFASGSKTIDPNRYLPVAQSFAYEPPDSASDPVPTETYALQNSLTSTTTHTTQVQYGVSVSVLANYLLASLKVTGSFEWTNTSTSQTSNQSTQSASLTIGGPAFGYTGPTNIIAYWDTVYNSFMFAFPT